MVICNNEKNREKTVKLSLQFEKWKSTKIKSTDHSLQLNLQFLLEPLHDSNVLLRCLAVYGDLQQWQNGENTVKLSLQFEKWKSNKIKSTDHSLQYEIFTEKVWKDYISFLSKNPHFLGYYNGQRNPKFA